MTSTMFAESQARAGVPDIDQLHQRRRTLIEEHGPTMALHRNKALLDARRKTIFATCLLEVRNDMDSQGQRYTEKVLEAAAVTHPRYKTYLDEESQDATDCLIWENEYREVEELINRGQSVMRMVTSEAGLAR